ncbi:MAG TPA: ABC transporter permease [Polyangia bacterium]|jgi:phospholipid/cholesterol/gamma-HCH transport system permease protein|nr:ABC transporter permease [Polyangia bacterium]
MTAPSSVDGAPGGQTESRLGGIAKALLDAAVRPLRGLLTYAGDRTLLLSSAMGGLFRKPFRLRLFLEQMEFVGVGSLPIICFVGFFSGAVSAQQAIAALRIFNQERFVGATVGISLAQELAPVFTALMITARAGSGMATELGSMRITEQIDALSTFAVDPIQYLITPRIVATVLMMPIMTMVFNIIGLVGAYIYSILLEHIDLGQFIEQFTYWTDPKDYVIGCTKAAVFGITLSVAACYQGYYVRGGAKEVGLATTSAVVAGSVSVLVSDFFLIDIFHILWPYQS